MSKDCIYLDYAASCLRVPEVFDATREFALHHYANIGRGSYDLAEEALVAYRQSKKDIADWIGCDPVEVLYTYSATYALNILALALEHNHILCTGDTILLSITEHHANIVPWQMLAGRIGANIRFVDIDVDYRIDLDDLRAKLDDTVKVVSLQYASNVTGAIHPLEEVRAIIGDRLFFVDATQMALHGPLTFGNIGCDAMVLSGHKMLADTGIGVLALRRELQKSWQSPLGGGGAIGAVTLDSYEQAGIPERWEPGTPHIVGAVSLSHALAYIHGLQGAEAHYQSLIPVINARFASLQSRGVRVFHSAHPHALAIWSFVIDGKHHIDIADALAEAGICVRAGHHCCQPFHTHFDIPGSVRISLGLQTREEEVEKFFEVLEKIIN